jgi:hypothetical protein
MSTWLYQLSQKSWTPRALPARDLGRRNLGLAGETQNLAAASRAGRHRGLLLRKDRRR